MKNLRPLLFACVALTTVAIAAPVSAQEMHIGVRGGGTWSLLSEPNDPRGEPTLLRGSTFDGFGWTAGVAGQWELFDLDNRRGGSAIGVELDALYSRHLVSGSDVSSSSGDRREVTLSTTMIRVPLLLYFDGNEIGPGLRFGIGPELLVGIESDADVDYTNTDGNVDNLTTTPVTHVGITANVAMDLTVTDNILLPIELRATWDPFVADSTVDRFENFRSNEQRGDFEAAFDWQLMLLTGFTWGV